jgi:hypothetical protein
MRHLLIVVSRGVEIGPSAPACSVRPIECTRAFWGNRSTNGGTEPNIPVRRVPRVPDTDDALGLAGGLGRDHVTGSLFEHVKAAFVGDHEATLLGAGAGGNCACPHDSRFCAPQAQLR